VPELINIVVVCPVSASITAAPDTAVAPSKLSTAYSFSSSKHDAVSTSALLSGGERDDIASATQADLSAMASVSDSPDTASSTFLTA